MRIVLTGTPGTGKSLASRALAGLTGGQLVDLNEFAARHKLFLRERGAFGERTVDLGKMKRALASFLEGKKNFVVEGHLACEFRVPADVVVVLRCDPRVLRKRLKKRKYSEEKIRENVLAELLDYCLIKAVENYGKTRVLQVDATRMVSAPGILKKIRGRASDRVDWSGQLLDSKHLKFLLKE